MHQKREYWQKVLRIVSAIARNYFHTEEDVEDATQEIIIDVLKYGTTSLYQIRKRARWKSINLVVQNSRWERRSQLISDEIVFPLEPDPFIADELSKRFKELTETRAHIFELYSAGVPSTEIAILYSNKPVNIRQIIWQTKQQLRKGLDENTISRGSSFRPEAAKRVQMGIIPDSRQATKRA